MAVLRRLVEEHERLAVEPGQPDQRAEEIARRKVERNDVALAHAMQPPAPSESQSSGPSEPERPVRNEYADEVSCGRVVFANGRVVFANADDGICGAATSFNPAQNA